MYNNNFIIFFCNNKILFAIIKNVINLYVNIVFYSANYFNYSNLWTKIAKSWCLYCKKMANRLVHRRLGYFSLLTDKWCYILFVNVIFSINMHAYFLRILCLPQYVSKIYNYLLNQIFENFLILISLTLKIIATFDQTINFQTKKLNIDSVFLNQIYKSNLSFGK